MDVQIDDADGLILPTPAAPLQEISAFHIAMELLRRNWIEHELTPTRNRLRCLLGDKLTLISSILSKMNLTDKIKEMIMTQLYLIDMKLGRWTWAEENICYAIDTLDENIFVYFPRSCDDFCWNYDDLTIDTEQTVKNMLRCDDFNDLQKFKLACAYCIEDEIKLLWPSVSLIWEPNVILLISNRYVRYWIEEKMVGGIHRNSQDYVNLIQQLSEYNRPAYRYYWNRLDSEHQIQVITHFIKFNISFPFEYLFSTLSLEQWTQLINEYPDNVMFYLIHKYAHNHRKADNILRVWNHISDMINDDIFRLMIRICCEHECKVKDCLHRLIWIQSPNHLKDSLLNELFSTKCRALLDTVKVPAFFTTDLRTVCFKKKSVYFRKLSISITRFYSPSEFEKLLTWCFTKKEIKSFKTKLLEDVKRSIEYEFDFSERDRLMDYFSGIGKL